MGYDLKSEVVGKHPATFSPEIQPDGQSSADKSKLMDAKARANGKHVFEWVHLRQSREEFLVEVTLVPLRIEDKTVLLTLWRDLTDIKENERKLVENSKMAALGEMSAGIAHEINNPLAVISGKVMHIQRRITSGSIEPQKLNEDLVKIQNNAERISKIIKGLKSFSRNAESDPLTPTLVSQVLGDALELCRERFAAKSVELRNNFQSNSFVSCRPAQILQVVMNLLGNALDAVEDNLEKWVSLEVSENAANVLIRVVDSGSGISEENQKRLMSPFFTTKSNGKGTGLGLSISRKIMEEHNGRLEYDKSSTKTCFLITIPKYKPQPNRAAV